MEPSTPRQLMRHSFSNNPTCRCTNPPSKSKRFCIVSDAGPVPFSFPLNMGILNSHCCRGSNRCGCSAATATVPLHRSGREYRQGDTGGPSASYGTVPHARRSYRLVSPSDDREKVSPVVQPHCHGPHLQPGGHPGLSLPRQQLRRSASADHRPRRGDGGRDAPHQINK